MELTYYVDYYEKTVTMCQPEWRKALDIYQAHIKNFFNSLDWIEEW